MSDIKKSLSFRASELLISINATDTTPRVILAHEKLQFNCKFCSNTGEKAYYSAIASLKNKGYAFRCEPCYLKKLSGARNRKDSVKSTESLSLMRAVDCAPRKIMSHDKILFRCASCENTGEKDYSEATRTFKKLGFAFQCSDCFKAKLADRGDTWLANIRAAAQSDAHKERARQNGKKRLLLKNLGNIKKFWNFGHANLQMISGTDDVMGTCLKCDNKCQKPLKKFIEAGRNQTGGCMNCWMTLTASEQYADFMGSISTKAGSASRLAQSLGLKAYWESLSHAEKWKKILFLWEARERWVNENPDLLYSSIPELQIRDWVRNELILECHKFSKGNKEIDIFVPSKNIGIEHNGLYWHSEENKANNYHYNKTEYYKSKNIRVIHIFGHLWQKRQSQVKSFLKSALGANTNSVGARGCELRIVEKSEAACFFEKYHIQGFSKKSTVIFGLYLNDELLAAASFSPHHRGVLENVLSRFVCKEDWTVQGALSRLSVAGVDFFGTSIISWADHSISDGAGYLAAGWIAEKTFRPDYFYTDSVNVFSKQSRKKSNVNTPKGMTEHEHALLDGLLRVYDCGKTRYRFVAKKP